MSAIKSGDPGGERLRLRHLVRELDVREHEHELSLQNEELRRDQQELLAARDAYRELYDQAPIGYLTLDERGIVEDANLTACGLLGIERARLRGMPLSSLMARDEAEQLHLHLVEVFATGIRVSRELELRSPTGARLHLRLDSIATEAADPPLRCRTTLTDISERIRMEERLRELNRELEQRVDERTDQLRLANSRLLEQLRERERIEEQLLNTRKMEAIARLAGGIAHDFNNLLTVIRLQLCVLRRTVPDRPAALASFEEIDQAVGFAAALTSKLLAFGRRDGSRGERIDARAVVLEMEPLLRRLCGDTITIVIRVMSEASWVQLDRTGLEQVLLNLAINARDAMPDGGELTIDVGRCQLDAREASLLRNGRPGDHVAIRVRDNGIGMDGATLQRLFEPFFSTKTGERGTGLGLATAYGAVAQAGGFIDVRSEVGRGSELTVYLPRADGDITSERAASLGDRGETILLVDDEDGVRIALADLLEDAGYRVIAAASGAAALDAIARQRGDIDLLLTDVAMPNMTGFTLASRVRALVPRASVIFMSGYLGGQPIDEAARYVAKPFSAATLLREIRLTLDAAGDARASSP